MEIPADQAKQQETPGAGSGAGLSGRSRSTVDTDDRDDAVDTTVSSLAGSVQPHPFKKAKTKTKEDRKAKKAAKEAEETADAAFLAHANQQLREDVSGGESPFITKVERYQHMQLIGKDILHNLTKLSAEKSDTELEMKMTNVMEQKWKMAKVSAAKSKAAHKQNTDGEGN